MGNKPDLKVRLLDAITSGAVARSVEDTHVYLKPEEGFLNTAHWVELSLSSVPVRNPVIEGFHGPTNQLVLAEKDLYQFDETFDLPIFQEKCKEYELARRGKSY